MQNYSSKFFVIVDKISCRGKHRNVNKLLPKAVLLTVNKSPPNSPTYTAICPQLEKPHNLPNLVLKMTNFYVDANCTQQ